MAAPDCFEIAYDNGGESFDRYTVFFRAGGPPRHGIRVKDTTTGRWSRSEEEDCWLRGMSENPQHPGGFNQFLGECAEFPFGAFSTDAVETLGKITDFDELPRKVQKAIADECSEV